MTEKVSGERPHPRARVPESWADRKPWQAINENFDSNRRLRFRDRCALRARSRLDIHYVNRCKDKSRFVWLPCQRTPDSPTIGS